ncbi:hypothetical protein [Prochlorococcus sp. MIT 1300]|uniref:hypothetical protein n=1 Tax=Prochlorococcus sp. MIT 1300 TaxID=3096218 RepID=UPI002A7655AD|nr:hypothetical protein [Prochlorococcus sp. MIT 1300]
MNPERTQLNININPELLIRLKSQAIKEGKTLTAFVTEKLSSIQTLDENNPLEERLLRIERHLKIDTDASNQEESIGKIFTDHGAEKYGQVAKKLFDLHLSKKGISIEDGLNELAYYLEKLPYSSPELVFQILLGNHKLTGLEMTKAYRHGSCAMRTALVQWSNDPLEELNKAFLNAVITKSLT